MTVRELREALREYAPDDEVRVVVYGWSRPSLNLPAISTSGPVARAGQVSGYSLNIICEEAERG